MNPLRVTRMHSVACIKQEIGNTGKFVGCGYGRTQKASDPVVCDHCGRQLFTTGTFLVIDLKEVK